MGNTYQNTNPETGNISQNKYLFLSKFLKNIITLCLIVFYVINKSWHKI